MTFMNKQKITNFCLDEQCKVNIQVQVQTERIQNKHQKINATEVYKAKTKTFQMPNFRIQLTKR